MSFKAVGQEKHELFENIKHGNLIEVKKIIIKHPHLMKTKTPCGNTPLMMSVIYYNPEMIAYFIAMRPSSVNDQNHQGNTVLIIVPHYTIKYFLNAGARYTIRNVDGLTMLEYLIYHNKTDHIKALYEYYKELHFIIPTDSIDFDLMARRQNHNKSIECDILNFKHYWAKTVNIPIITSHIKPQKNYMSWRYPNQPALISRFN